MYTGCVSPHDMLYCEVITHMRLALVGLRRFIDAFRTLHGVDPGPNMSRYGPAMCFGVCGCGCMCGMYSYLCKFVHVCLVCVHVCMCVCGMSVCV